MCLVPQPHKQPCALLFQKAHLCQQADSQLSTRLGAPEAEFRAVPVCVHASPDAVLQSGSKLSSDFHAAGTEWGIS